jgi:hypothetical protein
VLWQLLGMFDRGLTAARYGRRELPSLEEFPCLGLFKSATAIAREAVCKQEGNQMRSSRPYCRIWAGADGRLNP